MQKLTNSENTYLYFSFDADFFDTQKVTEELNINPTSVRIKNNPVPKSTSWKYKIEIGNESNLETPVENLIDIFEPKIETINRLKRDLNLETRLQFVIYININPKSSMPYFGLNKRTVEFLAKTGTEVDFDLYKTK